MNNRCKIFKIIIEIKFTSKSLALDVDENESKKRIKMRQNYFKSGNGILREKKVFVHGVM